MKAPRPADKAMKPTNGARRACLGSPKATELASPPTNEQRQDEPEHRQHHTCDLEGI
jgi:hypothetical protein